MLGRFWSYLARGYSLPAALIRISAKGVPFTEQQTFSSNFHTRQKGAKTPHKWDTKGDLLFCWFMILGAFSRQAGRASTSNLHSQVDNAITLSAGAFDASASTGRAQ